MKYGFIGRPTRSESIREDFEGFLAELESTPSKRVLVLFGFAWGNEIYERDWLELELTGSELRERVREAEALGLGAIGSDDLFITLLDLAVERQYCHEADVHVTADAAHHPYVAAERKKWLARGWEVSRCDADSNGEPLGNAGRPWWKFW